jgi:hypothetical protein
MRNYFVLMGARARLEQLRAEVIAILRECPELGRDGVAPALAQQLAAVLNVPTNGNGAAAPVAPVAPAVSRTAKPLKKPLSAARRAAIAKAQAARWAAKPKRRKNAKLSATQRRRAELLAQGLTTRGTPRKNLIASGKKTHGTPKGSWTPERRAKFIATMTRKGRFHKDRPTANDIDTPLAAAPPADLAGLAWQNDGGNYMAERPVSYSPEPPADVL